MVTTLFYNKFSACKMTSFVVSFCGCRFSLESELRVTIHKDDNLYVNISSYEITKTNNNKAEYSNDVDKEVVNEMKNPLPTLTSFMNICCILCFHPHDLIR